MVRPLVADFAALYLDWIDRLATRAGPSLPCRPAAVRSPPR